MHGKRVTEKEIQYIETLLNKDMSVASIADMLGLSQSTVNRVRTGTQCLQRKPEKPANAVTTVAEPTLFDIISAKEPVQEENEGRTEKLASVNTISDRVYEKLLDVAHANKQLGEMLTEVAQAYNRLSDVIIEMVGEEYGV